MKKPRQTDFFKGDRENGPGRSSHGGSIGQGKRKIERPFHRSKVLHVVLKSEIARGPMSMLGPQFQLKIDQIIVHQAKKSGVTIHRYQNVGSHLHLMIKAGSRKGLRRFLRTVAGLIARLVTGARKGKPAKEKFWAQIAFSRVIHGARDFKSMLNYLDKNRIEAEVGGLARKSVEIYEKAMAKARRTGRDVWEFL